MPKKQPDPSDYVYAIDFGTSNSLMAAATPAGAQPPLPLDGFADDPTILRSIIFTPTADEWYFGSEAIKRYGEHFAEGRLLRSIKKYLPETTFETTLIHNRSYSLTDLIAKFLRTMRDRANESLGVDIRRAVLGRPAAFDLAPERDQLAEARLEAAARQAGFSEVLFCPEPIAAAMAFRHTLTASKTVLIADFGGGTSDFTVLKMGREGFKPSDVLSVGGVAVAGDAFDGSLMKHMISPHFGTQVRYRHPMGKNDMHIPISLVNRMCSPADISLLGKQDALQLLKKVQRWSLDEDDAAKLDRLFILIEEHLGYKLFGEIETAKRALSKASSAHFRFHHPGIAVEDEIFRSDFASASFDRLQEIMKSLDETMAQAQVRPSDIDIVCCTGGTAKISSVHEALVKRFGQDKMKSHKNFHSVIEGLAERAHQWLVTG